MNAQPIPVVANSFAITQLPTKTYYQYDVVITPEVGQFRKRQRIMNHLQSDVAPDIFHPRALYDSKAILYASHRLRLPAGDAGQFCFTFSSKTQVDPSAKGAFVVMLKATGNTVSPDSLRHLVSTKRTNTASGQVATNLLQLIIRQSSNQKYVHNARAFFVEQGKRSIGKGLEIWLGFYQSVRPGPDRMIINIDTSATVVYQSGPLIDVCIAFLRGGRNGNVRDLDLRPNSPDFRKLQKHLKNLHIRVEKIKGTKTIRELIPNAGRYTFQLDDGASTTVEEHYLRAHGIRLKHRDIIGVQTSGKNAPHPVIIPLEVCKVVEGQFYRHTLPPELTRDMVSFTAVKPQERYRRIVGNATDRDAPESPLAIYRQSEFVHESGMEIDRNPIRINAKLLHPPPVNVNSSVITPANGKWDMRNRRVLSPATLTDWAAINFDNATHISKFERKFRELIDACLALGLNITPKPPAAFVQGNPHNVEKSLMDMMRDIKTNFEAQQKPPPEPTKFIIFIILPDSAEAIKHRVKFWGDCALGYLTQCFRSSKFGGANNQFMNLVVLKLNARLGGTNNNVLTTPVMKKLSGTPFMFVGADVGHPGPKVLKPSLTSLVSSVDQQGIKYTCTQRIQRPRLEIIVHLKEMMTIALKRFFLAQGVMPVNIIFFRDGVSEGEYETVKNCEIAAIREAISSLAEDPRTPPPVLKQWSKMGYPKLLYVVVGKRHHNSFFFERHGGPVDNCPPGTLIDNGVTNPSGQDFFLQSHGAIQGTSRSGHYVVLENEMSKDITTPALQEICFSLCHIYANCTRSISIPTPVYYADMACTSGESHFDPDDRALQYGSSDGASTMSGSEEFNLEAWENAFKSVNPRLENAMHFL